jgi:hypothetical protein
MPSLIETHEAKAETLAKDIPTLQEVVKATWRKEDELRKLKTELASMNRKIELSLKPVDESEDKKEEEKQSPANDSQTLSVPERLQQAKEAMGERLIIGSVPQYNPIIQPKGIRL